MKTPNHLRSREEISEMQRSFAETLKEIETESEDRELSESETLDIIVRGLQSKTIKATES